VYNIFEMFSSLVALGVEAAVESFGPRIGTPLLHAVQLAEKTVYNLGDWSL
jgi:hypothetical protein